MSNQSISSIASQQFARQSNLPAQTDKLWQIESGSVKTLTWLEDGTIITLGVWGPGDIVGRALSKADPYEMQCLTTVNIIPYHKDHSQELIELLFNHIQQAEELAIIRSYRKVDSMIIKLLTWLSKKFGRSVQNGNLIDLRLTHQDIADILGLTRVTVTRFLGQLEDQGAIKRIQAHRIILKEEEFWHYEI